MQSSPIACDAPERLRRRRERSRTGDGKAQILSAATVVKQSGAVPGLVVAPTLEEPSGAAMDAWIDWSQPIDRLSFNLYKVKTAHALATLDEMAFWCNARPRCPGFYVTSSARSIMARTTARVRAPAAPARRTCRS